MKSIAHRKQNVQPNLFQILDRRKSILIRRDKGGLGDILMHRMLFEDFNLLLPDINLTFACPEKYIPAVYDHKFLSNVLSNDKVVESDYGVIYNTSSTCINYEIANRPFSTKNRSDIWAEGCGVTLTQHNMHIEFTENEISWAKEKLGNKPVALIAPVTAMASKNLLPHQTEPVANKLRDHGFSVFYLHNREHINPTLTDLTIRQFMSIINESNLIISSDTAAYHCAGGLGRPTVGVFGWADGKVYGKYYKRSILVQRHREDDPTWTCGPCYDFPGCKLAPDPNIIQKPCITSLNSEDIWSGVIKAWKAFPEFSPTYMDTRFPLDVLCLK
jgi:ADP-heptose:LPS heptosyltransferase